MSLDSKDSNKTENRQPAFRIYGNGIDSTAIEQSVIRSSEERRRKSSDDYSRVNALDFAPSLTRTGFDPGKITELFESSVSPPDFKNPKYRYLPGFFRKIAYRIFPLFAVLYDKLSENKIQAFYELVHEMIAVNHRHKRLREEVQQVLEDHLNLRSRVEALSYKQSPGETGNASKLLSESDELLEDYFGESMLQSVVENDRLDRGGDLLLVDEMSDSAARFLNKHGFSMIRLHCPLRSGILTADLDYSKKKGEFAMVSGSSDLMIAGLPDQSISVLIHSDVENITGNPEAFFELLPRKMKKNGSVYIQSPGLPIDSPFQKISRFRVDPEKLTSMMEEHGFQLIEKRDQSDGSYQMYFVLVD